MRFSKAAIGLAAAAVIAAAVGCAKRGRPGQLDGEGASFVALEVKADQVRHEAEPDSDLARRTTLIDFSVCVQDVALLKPIIGQDFELRGGPEPLALRSDSQGCLRWRERFAYDPGESAFYARHERQLVGQAPQIGALTLVLAVNPWLDGADAVVDVIKHGFPGSEGQAMVAGDSLSRVTASSLSRQFLGHDFSRYAVSPDLSLTVAHRFRVQITPKVLAREASGGLKEAAIRGHYRLITVLAGGQEGDPVTADNVIAEDSCQAPLVAGMLTCDLTYAYPDLIRSLWRTRLFVELMPVDSAGAPLKGFAPSAFTGYVVPAKEGTVMLVPTDEDVQLAARSVGARAVPAGDGLTPLQRLRRSGRIRFAEVAQFPDRPRESITPTRASFALFLHDGKTARAQILKYICILAYGDRSERSSLGLLDRVNPPKDGLRMKGESDYDYCRRVPEAAVRFTLQDFVEKLRDPRPRSPKSNMYAPLTFSVDVSQGLDESASDSWGWNLSANANATGGAGLPGGLGLPGSEQSPFNLGASLSVGAGLSRAYTRTRSLALGQHASASAGRNLMVEHRSFEINADVRRCALFDARLGARFKPIQVCAPNVEARRFRENYFLLAQNWNWSDSPFMDIVEGGGALRFFVRGENRLADFARVVGNPDLAIVIGQSVTPIRQLLAINEALLNFSPDQGVPGAYDAYMSTWYSPGQDCRTRWLPDWLQPACHNELPK
jgi:hypothetical protein